MKQRWQATLVATIFTVGLAVLAVPVLKAANSIVIKGSDTMLMVGQGWAEAYQKKHTGVDISIQGGGSGTGISALINGTTDICQASRAMKGSEIEKCKQRNFVPVATTVALDGVAFAVNTANPVKSLNLDQLKGIYTGTITNWKQVGGADMPIVVLSRESSSGTYGFVQEFVLDHEKYRQDALLMPSTKAIQQEITNNPKAIGYGGEAYFKEKKNVKILPIAMKAGKEPVMPTDVNVRSSKYPVSRPLYLYTKGKPSGAIADYIKFCLSPEGQKIASELGYVSLK
jgi:phosphate transport system substrate-binding protein